MAKTGSSSNSVSRRNRVFASELGQKDRETDRSTERRNALKVSLCCSRKKARLQHQAKTRREKPARAAREQTARFVRSRIERKAEKDDHDQRMKTIVVVSSSRERNSVRSSLPSRTAVLGRRLIQASAKVRMERKVRAGACVRGNRAGVQANGPRDQAKKFPIPRAGSSEWCGRNRAGGEGVSASQLTPWGSSPVAGSSSRRTAGSCSKARARWPRAGAYREKMYAPARLRRPDKPTSSSSASTRSCGSGHPQEPREKQKIFFGG